MPRSPRLPRTPECPECDRPGRYVWQEDSLLDAYRCVTASCPTGEYRPCRGRGRQVQATDEA